MERNVGLLKTCHSVKTCVAYYSYRDMFLFHSVPPKIEHQPFYLYCSPGFSLNPSKVASKSSNQLKPLLFLPIHLATRGIVSGSCLALSHWTNTFIILYPF
ncbi:hypothetical protein HanIR_Chr08g0344631 [Helianthus annuus]|nr:hypothetical protein HanIR_Chr08g0344631 [Helianthus annuus]